MPRRGRRRSIAGSRGWRTARSPIVSAGKLLGTYRKHNFAHIRFVLSQRRAVRWSSAERDLAALLKPGHPVYERLHAEWRGEDDDGN